MRILLLTTFATVALAQTATPPVAKSKKKSADEVEERRDDRHDRLREQAVEKLLHDRERRRWHPEKH